MLMSFDESKINNSNFNEPALNRKYFVNQKVFRSERYSEVSYFDPNCKSYYLVRSRMKTEPKLSLVFCLSYLTHLGFLLFMANPIQGLLKCNQ